jgi:alpha-N-arabinofuranosidase
VAPVDPVAVVAALFTFSRSESGHAQITVRASDPAPHSITRRFYGKFTEHLGANVYLGAWAQLVPNPGCEGPSVWGNPWGSAEESITRVTRETQKRWGVAGFDASLSAQTGCGFWWAPGGTGVPIGTDGKYGLDAGINGLSQRMWAPAGKSAGIVTPVFVPVHRCREIEISVWGKAQGGAKLSVGLTSPRHGAKPFVSTPLIAGPTRTQFAQGRLSAGPEWRKLTARLKVPTGCAKRGEPLFLSIVAAGGGTAWVDQVLAFPKDHLDGWDPDVIRYYRDAKVSLIRFPGGNFVSGYRWKDGVGPLDSRPVKPNPAWEGVEWNHVGTDEWLRFCELLGAEPMICVNAGDGTPEEAAEWVRYCRGKVKLWEVGNELYGNWQIGWTDAKGNAGRYADFAKAMRKADPGIRLIACGDTPDWNTELVKGNGRSVESISVHWLPLHDLPRDADPEKVASELLSEASQAAGHLLWPRGKPMAEAGLQPALALDELQILNRLNSTVLEALFYSAVFNEAARSGLVELLTHSALINHGGGLVKRNGIVAPQPVHWALWLYSTQPGLRPVPVAVAGPGFEGAGKYLPKAEASSLDALALLGKDGKSLTLIVTNRDTRRAIEADLDVASFLKSGTTELARLSPESLISGADMSDPDRDKPRMEKVKVRDGRLSLSFPPYSITRLVLKR